MGIAIAVIAASLISIMIGIVVGRVSVPDRKVRKTDLTEAREALHQVSSIIWEYNDQLDIVGKTMQNEVHQVVNNYWRGAKV